MNKHFEDSLYYVKRAAEHAKRGVAETVEPVATRLRELAGRESEPEPGRVEAVAETVRDLEARAEAEAREAVGGARERVEAYRSRA